MKASSMLLAMVVLTGLICGCGGGRDNTPVQSVPALRQDVRIRVVDVSNKTGKLYDVDAIGLLWNGIEESLRSKGLLWTQDAGPPVLLLRAEILKYEKGNVFVRNVMPVWGKTVLAARCEIKDGERVVASAESTRTISAGKEGLSFSTWREIYRGVAEDLVNQVVNRI